MEQLTPDDRIAAQEKALNAVNCELALLRHHMEAKFASMQASTDAQFAGMRQYIDDGLVKLRLEMQLYTNQAVAAAVAELSAKIDRNGRWTIGLLISILTGLIAMAARGLL